MSPCHVNLRDGMEGGIRMSPCPVNLRDGMEGISVCLPILLTSEMEWRDIGMSQTTCIYVSLSC